MKLGTPQKEVVTKFAAKFGLPSGETAAQEWTHKLAQQMKFSFPA